MSRPLFQLVANCVIFSNSPSLPFIIFFGQFFLSECIPVVSTCVSRVKSLRVSTLASGSKEEFAKRVAMDLFRYMESFQAATLINAEQMVVPLNILDRWFNKFQDKFRRDPDFLTRAAEKS